MSWAANVNWPMNLILFLYVGLFCFALCLYVFLSCLFHSVFELFVMSVFFFLLGLFGLTHDLNLFPL